MTALYWDVLSVYHVLGFAAILLEYQTTSKVLTSSLYTFLVHCMHNVQIKEGIIGIIMTYFLFLKNINYMRKIEEIWNCLNIYMIFAYCFSFLYYSAEPRHFLPRYTQFNPIWKIYMYTQLYYSWENMHLKYVFYYIENKLVLVQFEFLWLWCIGVRKIAIDVECFNSTRALNKNVGWSCGGLCSACRC